MNRRERIAMLVSQRGVLAVTTPLLIMLIILFTVLLLDGARLYAVKREMQAVANAAAMAAAEVAQACGGEPIGSESTRNDRIVASANAAAVAQGMNRIGGNLSDVQAGTLASADDRVLGFRPVVNSIDESNAVRVVFRASQPISLLLPAQFADINMEATAVARREVIATVSVSGSTAVIGGSEGNAGLLGDLLGAILGGNGFRLDATDIRSLANATFVLGDFLAALEVDNLLGAVDQIVGADELLRAILAGLDNGVGSTGVALDNLLEASGLITTDVRLGDIINLVGSIPPSSETRVPVYDTIVALALNVIEGQLINVPINANINVAGLLDAKVGLLVGQAPSVVIGPARFHPNGDPLVSFDVADVSLSLLITARVLGLADIDVPLLVNAGGGSGHLDYAGCASGASNDVVLGFEVQSRAATISTDRVSDSTGLIEESEIRATVLPAFSSVIPTLVVSGKLRGVSIASHTGIQQGFVVYNLHDREPRNLDFGSDLSMSSLNGVLNLQVELETRQNCRPLDLACLLGGVLGPVLELVNGALDALDDLLEDAVLGLVSDILNNVLGPLLKSLGLNVGGMTIEVTDATQTGVALIDCSIMPCDIIIEEE